MVHAPGLENINCPAIVREGEGKRDGRTMCFRGDIE